MKASSVALDELLLLRVAWRRAGKRFVFTNGVFDLLHAGHVDYLEQARALGDMLVVAINSDESTRALKGDLRPLMPEQARACMLAALRCVDYVTIFAEPTAEAVVAALQPDVYAKGADYAAAGQSSVVDEARLPEARLVRSCGGQVVLLPYQAGFSTTELINRIVAAHAGRDSS